MDSIEVLCLFFVAFSVTGMEQHHQVTQITDPVIHGEGPHWDAERQVLFYVDITNQTVNRFDPKTKTNSYVHIDGGPVSLVIPDKFDETRFVLGRGRDIVSVTWDGKSPEASDLKVLATVDEDKPGNRLNDGKVDASGRLWAGRYKYRTVTYQGTMGPEDPDLIPFQGTLYSFDWSDDFRPIAHVSSVSVSNGIAWNKDDNLMYYIDSSTKVVSVYDFDLITGSLSNKREVFNLEKNNITGLPDGMTIDEKENLWIAVYRGSCVLHVDTKEKKLLKKIEFPVTQVTSCTFGGDNLEDLYVTSSRVSLSKEDLKEQPLAGAVFKVTGLGVRGQVKSNSVRIP